MTTTYICPNCKRTITVHVNVHSIRHRCPNNELKATTYIPARTRT